MVETIIQSVGRGGEFPTLAQWASQLPPDLVACDRAYVAELTAGNEDPGNVVFRSRCDGTRHLTIRAAAGQGFADLTDPIADPLATAIGFGATIRSTEGAAICVAGAETILNLTGLQIVTEDGPAIADDGDGRCQSITGCLIESVSAEPMVSIRGSDAIISACALIQRGPGDGIHAADGAHVEGCTIFKPERLLAQGVGVAVGEGAAPAVRSTVSFGFRQAFGEGLGPSQALISDQMNMLASPESFAAPDWRKNQLAVDAGETRPGPYGFPLQRLTSTHDADAKISGAVLPNIQPGQRVSFSLIVADPTALTSALVVESAAGAVELRVRWTETPPGTSLAGHRTGLRAVDGGVDVLGAGLYRLWVVAENRAAGALDVCPVFYLARGIENAGFSVDAYAGCAMAGFGYLGNGFCFGPTPPGVQSRGGVNPDDALRGTSSVLPDLRPIEGGPLDTAGLLGGRDILGRGRLVPDTAGALSLNPAPKFLGAAVGGLRQMKRPGPLYRPRGGSAPFERGIYQ